MGIVSSMSDFADIIVSFLACAGAFSVPPFKKVSRLRVAATNPSFPLHISSSLCARVREGHVSKPSIGRQPFSPPSFSILPQIDLIALIVMYGSDSESSTVVVLLVATFFMWSTPLRTNSARA